MYMRIFTHIIICLTLCSLVGGCVTTQSTFIDEGYRFSDIKVCRSYMADLDKLDFSYSPKTNEESDYIHALRTQILVRELTEDNCNEIIEEGSTIDNKTIINTLIAVASVAAVVAYGKSLEPSSSDDKYERLRKSTKKTAFYNGLTSDSSSTKSSSAELSCPCPYDTASDGSRCGERSAWSRAGGESPICSWVHITREDILKANNK